MPDNIILRVDGSAVWAVRVSNWSSLGYEQRHAWTHKRTAPHAAWYHTHALRLPPRKFVSTSARFSFSSRFCDFDTPHVKFYLLVPIAIYSYKFERNYTNCQVLYSIRFVPDIFEKQFYIGKQRSCFVRPFFSMYSCLKEIYIWYTFLSFSKPALY